MWADLGAVFEARDVDFSSRVSYKFGGLDRTFLALAVV